jgi:hypothetical protein
VDALEPHGGDDAVEGALARADVPPQGGALAERESLNSWSASPSMVATTSKAYGSDMASFPANDSTRKVDTGNPSTVRR